MASLLLIVLMVAALTVPDERGLCQNCAQPRDPHHMGDTGCYFSDPTSNTVAGLGTHNRVVATTSCEVSCPVDGGDFAVYSQSGA